MSEEQKIVPSIDYTLKGKIAIITLTSKMNTLNIELSRRLLEIIDELEANPKVSVIIFKTSGDKVFSAGWDLTMFKGDFLKIKDEFFTTCGKVSERLYFCKKPIIAQIQGSAIGTGATLAFSCDFRFVADKKDIFFRLPEVDLPLFPTTGPSVSTFSVLGPVHSKEMLLTGDKFYLETLDKWGAFTKICPPEELEKEVFSFAKKLARKPANLLHTIKPMLNIFGMDRARDWYKLEYEMAEYFFIEWLKLGELPDLDEFVKSKWKKFTGSE